MKNGREIRFKRVMYAVLAAVGFLLLMLAAFMSSDGDDAVAGYCYGFGAAAAALGVGYLLQAFFCSQEEVEEINRRKKIEVEDERNVSIRNRAGSAVNSITTYALCVLIIGASLFRADVAVVLMLVALLLARFVLLVAFHGHYARTA
jgi:uncharacterized membrane protein